MLLKENQVLMINEQRKQPEVTVLTALPHPSENEEGNLATQTGFQRRRDDQAL